MNKYTLSGIVMTLVLWVNAQSNATYWQQHVDYTMEIDMNVENYQYDGKQKLVYTNNSPDELKVVFYHLYPNAFQPNSEMYKHYTTLPDPDRRFVKSVLNISNLKPEEQGFIRINSLKQNKKWLSMKWLEPYLRLHLINL